MIQRFGKRVCRGEVTPNAEEWDSNGTYPKDAITKAHELGLLNVTIPEEYGGAGMSSVDEMIICEELSRRSWICHCMPTTPYLLPILF